MHRDEQRHNPFRLRRSSRRDLEKALGVGWKSLMSLLLMWTTSCPFWRRDRGGPWMMWKEIKVKDGPTDEEDDDGHGEDGNSEDEKTASVDDHSTDTGDFCTRTGAASGL